jgi:type III secretion system YopN/LcrE/InvE/MxiC family regulator
MGFDGAQFLRNPIRFDRMDTMMPTVMNADSTPKGVETGRLGGANVVVHSDATADLMDSMEELSMQFEEKAAKKLSDRKLGETRSRFSLHTAAIDNWMKAMPDMPGKEEMEKLLKLLRQMQQGGNVPDAFQLKNLLSSLSGDPSHQFAMLDILELSLASGEDELRSLIGSARSKLVNERGAEIKAGINLAAEVNARATSPDEMSALRNLYRSEILGFKSPQDCFRSILASRGAGALDSAIDFLTKGCGSDLTSAAPSRDPVELRRIIQDLQCVQVLKTVLDTMNALVARIGREFGEKMLLNGEAMTSRIVDFTEKPCVSGNQFAVFENECGIMQLLAKMDFTREMMNVFRKLSPRLFSTEEDRRRLIDSSQEHLDELIAEEIDPDQRGDD